MRDSRASARAVVRATMASAAARALCSVVDAVPRLLQLVEGPRRVPPASPSRCRRRRPRPPAGRPRCPPPVPVPAGWVWRARWSGRRGGRARSGQFRQRPGRGGDDLLDHVDDDPLGALGRQPGGRADLHVSPLGPDEDQRRGPEEIDAPRLVERTARGVVGQRHQRAPDRRARVRPRRRGATGHRWGSASRSPRGAPGRAPRTGRRGRRRRPRPRSCGRSRRRARRRRPRRPVDDRPNGRGRETVVTWRGVAGLTRTWRGHERLPDTERQSPDVSPQSDDDREVVVASRAGRPRTVANPGPR